MESDINIPSREMHNFHVEKIIVKKIKKLDKAIDNFYSLN
jgi:hypothetical protein